MDGHGSELAAGLHRIEAPLGPRFVACYLIVGDDAALLYDTGVDATIAGSVVPYLAAAGIAPARVRWLVTSHCDVDHIGGAAAAKEAFRVASLVAHRGDVELTEDVERIIEERYRQFRDEHGIDVDEVTMTWCREVTRTAPVDEVIDGHRVIDLGGREVTIVPTPGHSDGSISLWDPTSGALLSSDAVLGDSIHLADGRPAFPPTYRDVTPYRETIAAIEALPFRWLLPAHEPVMDEAAGRAFLATSRRFADVVEAAVVTQLEDAGGPRTTRELIVGLAPKVGDWDEDAWDLLAYAIVGHLDVLERDGRVIRGEGTPASWSISTKERT